MTVPFDLTPGGDIRTLTPAELFNGPPGPAPALPGIPYGTRYYMISAVGTQTDTITLNLPPPFVPEPPFPLSTDERYSYHVVIENVATDEEGGGPILIVQHTGGAGATVEISAANPGEEDVAVEGLIQQYIDGNIGGRTYRTEVVVTDNGVFRVPGYSPGAD